MNRLPTELFPEIGKYLDSSSLCNLIQTEKKQKICQDVLYEKVYQNGYFFKCCNLPLEFILKKFDKFQKKRWGKIRHVYRNHNNDFINLDCIENPIKKCLICNIIHPSGNYGALRIEKSVIRYFCKKNPGKTQRVVYRKPLFGTSLEHLIQQQYQTHKKIINQGLIEQKSLKNLKNLKLHFLKWIYKFHNEDFTQKAMEYAIQFNNFSVFKWLYSLNNPIFILPDVYNTCAFYGNVKMLSWLLKNTKEIPTGHVFTESAFSGELGVLKWCFQNVEWHETDIGGIVFSTLDGDRHRVIKYLIDSGKISHIRMEGKMDIREVINTAERIGHCNSCLYFLTNFEKNKCSFVLKNGNVCNSVYRMYSSNNRCRKHCLK